MKKEITEIDETLTSREAFAEAYSLTPMQMAFVEEYAANPNVRRAARVVGLGGNPSKFMARPQVIAAIRAMREQRAKRMQLSNDSIIRALCRIAEVDPAELFDEMGNPLPLDRVPSDTRRSLASVTITERHGENGSVVSRKVKFNDRLKALELLARIQGLLTDRVEHHGAVNLAEFVALGFKRD